MKILVTGHAGFIGNAVALHLLERGDEVIGIDNLNDYYDVGLKQARLDRLAPYDAFTDIRADVADRQAMQDIFREHRPQRVVHLAAQAGVRYSLENPAAYVDSNLVGFGNILEGCRHQQIEHLVYASSSSVYGNNTRMPFSVNDNVDQPVSLYAATKKANELMAHSYSHLYGLPVTGLRYFTVYGPWGRPDMSPWLFTSAILEGRPIDVFNHGKMQRDFTYIDDIVAGTIAALECTPKPAPATDSDAEITGAGHAPYRLYNIGNNQPVELMTFIGIIEDALGKKAQKRYLPMQDGDVLATYANIDDLKRDVGYMPSTPLTEGVGAWVAWYREYAEARNSGNHIAPLAWNGDAP